MLRVVSFVLLAFALGHAAERMRPSLSGPFRYRFLGANAARYSLAARNYVRYGFLANLGAPDFTPGDPGERPRVLYLHHPPLVPLVVGASFAWFGEAERSATLPFYCCGLAALLLLFLVARRCLRGVGPAATVLLAAVVPMTGFYGGHVDPQGPLLVLPILAAVLFYQRFRERGRTIDLWLIAVFLVAGFLADWPAAYVAGLIPAADFLLKGGRRDFRLWLLPLLACCLFGLFLVWISAMDLSFREALFGPASLRTPLALAGAPAADLLAGTATFCVRVLQMFTVPLLVLALLPLLRGVRRLAAHPAGPFAAVLFVLLAAGVVHILLFPQGALVHDYWTFLLLPPLALAAGAGVEAVRARATAWGGEGFGVLLVLLLCGGTTWLGDRQTRAAYRECDAEVWALHGKIGMALREQVRPWERVLTNSPFYNPVGTRLLIVPEFSYYSDRAVRGAIQTHEDLERAIAEEGEFDRFLYVPLGSSAPPILAELDAAHPRHEFPLFGLGLAIYDLTK